MLVGHFCLLPRFGLVGQNDRRFVKRRKKILFFVSRSIAEEICDLFVESALGPNFGFKIAALIKEYLKISM